MSNNNLCIALRHFSLFTFHFSLFLLFSCGSVPKERSVESREESVAAYKGVLLQTGETQRRDSVVAHWEWDEGEEWMARTYTVRYDTSVALDSAMDRYPVQEEHYAWVTRQKKSRMEGGMSSGFIETEEAAIAALEDASLTQVSEKTKKQKPGKDPYRWRYLTAGIVALAFLIWCLRVKNSS